MNKIIKTVLSLVAIALLLMPYSTALAKDISDSDFVNNASTEVVGIGYADQVGYYLIRPISQGLEFEIIGEKPNQYHLDKYGNGSILEPTRGGSFLSPTDVITWNNLTGVWWGGIIQDVNIAGGGAVCAVTIATSNNTQSKASVRPGLTANWYSGDWQNKDIRSDVMKPVGIAGNAAKWDLR